MDDRERLLAVLRGETPDYVPFTARFNDLSPAQRKGVWNYPWPEKNGGNDTQAMYAYAKDRLGVTMYAYASPTYKAGLESCETNIYTNGGLLIKEIHTPLGTLSAAVEYNAMWPYGEDIPLGHDFTAHHRKAWVTGMSDVKKLVHIFSSPAGKPDALKRLANNFEAAFKLRDAYDMPVVSAAGQGLTLALQMFLPEPLMFAVKDEPETVEEFLKLEHGVTMDNIRLACESGCDIISRNGYYECCSFFSPAMLERFVGGYLRAECELAHSYGKPVVYTLHSGYMPMIGYLKAIPFDCIYGIDLGFPGADILKLKRELGDKFIFEMGPCSTREFSSDDPSDVRAAMRGIVETWGKKGLILTPSTSFHSIMPWRNFEAAVDEWKKLRWI